MDNIKSVLVLALLMASAAVCCGALSDAELNRIADAIWRIEGGADTRYPYGVKSVVTDNPRRVCINSIRSNWELWVNAGKPGYFGDYMGDRYCPVENDTEGNANWKRNFRALVGAVKQ